MKIIFGTTNERKVEDLQNIIKELNLDLELLSMKGVGWNRGEIEENGKTIEENSLIKANAIFDFCKENNIKYPIITDDAGLFCEALNGEPGVYTARYADDELKQNPNLPKHQAILKLLRKLNDKQNRNAAYRCAVTCMMPDGSYFQETRESKGTIANNIIGELKKPYFYSVFILDGYDKPFNDLTVQELSDTYKYTALKEVLRELNEIELKKDEDLER